MCSYLHEIDVVILCGGFGKRLRSIVGDRPKVLVQIGNKAFIDLLIENLLLPYGLRHIVLSVGYLKEQIIDYFKQKKQLGYDIRFSEEEEPLGTGGALKKVKPLIKGNTLLVMNGDSFCEVDFDRLLAFHSSKRAVVTMVLAHTDSVGDYGSVTLDDSLRIQDFSEKTSASGSKLVNAGIYLMQKDVFSYMPQGDVFSLEYDFFPRLAKSGCYGYPVKSELFDIGTPERYEKAKQILKARVTLKVKDK